MKKLVLKNLNLSAGSILSVEEKTRLLGGIIYPPSDGTRPYCRCKDGSSIPLEGERCPCWCLPCDFPPKQLPKP